MTIGVLAVDLRGERIGRIRQDRLGIAAFRFDPEYLREEQNPSLSQSLIDDNGKPMASPRGYSGKLPPFFENLLPEGPLRAYLAKAGKVSEDDSWGLLRMLGRDLPGAVTVRSTTADEAPNAPLSTEAVPGASPGAWRFSLSGYQFKMPALLQEAGRFAVPDRGVGGDWIVKLPSIQLPNLTENEFALMALAERVGLSVPERRLVPLDDIDGIPVGLKGNGGNAYVVRRFDRGTEGQRIHAEDFAQVFGVFPDRKYDHYCYADIAALLRAKAGVDAAVDFTRQVAFSVLIGNGDMHLKNVALLYEDPCAPSLSPAYDLVSTVPYLPGDALALGFGRGKKMDGVSARQALQYAQAAGLNPCAVTALLREVAGRTMDAWQGLPEREVLPKAIHAEIDRQINQAGQRTANPNPWPKPRTGE